MRDDKMSTAPHLADDLAEDLAEDPADEAWLCRGSGVGLPGD